MTTFKDILKKSFMESFNGSTITFQVILLSLAITIVLALYLFLVYRLLVRKSFYNMNFNLALVGMTVVTAGIVLAIQSNLILSLGMVGALSIVRFRSAIKDPMDLFFLFWGAATGIMCGARQHLLAVIVALVLSLILFVISHIPVLKASYVLVVNGGDGDINAIKDCVKEHCKYFNVKSCYLSEGKLRMIIEIKTDHQETLLHQLSKMGGGICIGAYL